VNRLFLCRRHKKWPSSRQRFLPHQARVAGSLRWLASTCPRVPQRTRHSQAPTSRPRPRPAWPCLYVFASAPASPVTLVNPLDCPVARTTIPNPGAQFQSARSPNVQPNYRRSRRCIGDRGHVEINRASPGGDRGGRENYRRPPAGSDSHRISPVGATCAWTIRAALVASPALAVGRCSPRSVAPHPA
jgi:hypothetical protein